MTGCNAYLDGLLDHALMHGWQTTAPFPNSRPKAIPGSGASCKRDWVPFKMLRKRIPTLSAIRNAGHDSGKLDRIAQPAAPMQPSQPAHGIGIASISVTKPGIHLPQKPAAGRGRESRDQANANG